MKPHGNSQVPKNKGDSYLNDGLREAAVTTGHTRLADSDNPPPVPAPGWYSGHELLFRRKAAAGVMDATTASFPAISLFRRKADPDMTAAPGRREMTARFQPLACRGGGFRRPETCRAGTSNPLVRRSPGVGGKGEGGCKPAPRPRTPACAAASAGGHARRRNP